MGYQELEQRVGKLRAKTSEFRNSNALTRLGKKWAKNQRISYFSIHQRD